MGRYFKQGHRSSWFYRDGGNVFQPRALAHPLLPSFAAEELAPFDATANRFEFSVGLRLIDVLYPVLS